MFLTETKLLRILVVLTALMLAAFTASAEPVDTKVTYVAASSVYIDAGALRGVEKGDTCIVIQKGTLAARMVVEFVADNSSSCRNLDSLTAIHEGDAVQVQVIAKMRTAAARADTMTSAAAVTPLPAAPVVRKTTSNKARMSGNIGLQVLGQMSHDQLSYQYFQPGLTFRAKVENMFGGGPTLNVRMNLRREQRNMAHPGLPQTEWLNRVYEVSLIQNSQDATLNYSVGRLLANRLAGIGYIDGALLGLRMAEKFEVGAFGGTQPDLRTTDVRTSTTKGGAYAAYQSGAFGGEFFNATLAAAGEYYKGQISREFLYEQTNYSTADQFSAYESAEINVNRGWRKTAQTSALELTNLLCNVRYSPVKAVGITASYDNHTSYRTYETRSIADSLFDTSLQQGYRLGIDLRLPWAMQADVQGGLRSRHSETTSTTTIGGGLSTRNLFSQKVYLGARVTSFRSRFSNGYQPTVMISRLMWSRMTVGVQAGWDVYDLKSFNQHVSSNWQRASVDWMINSILYSSASYELYRGDNLSGSRYYAELGYRF